MLCLGVNHQTAPLVIREKVAFDQPSIEGALIDLLQNQGAQEAVILSTCNRTEIYSDVSVSDLLEWMSKWHSLTKEELLPFLYCYQDEEAVRHVFRVASGLDSMVLGETQILGQLKQAVAFSQRFHGAQGNLGVIFQQTFQVAKQVRSQTKIGQHSVSLASAALKLVLRVYPSLSDVSVLLIGAGDMMGNVAAYFADQQPTRMVIANRSWERASQLAQEHQIEAMLLMELPKHLHEFDVVITSTASSLPIVGKGLMERVLKARRRPMVMVDLAVPRDIEPEVAQLEDVYLYSVDDLASLVQEGYASRLAETAHAEELINEAVHQFQQKIAQRSVIPLIRHIRDQASQMHHAEMNKAIKKLAQGETPEHVVQALSYALLQKWLHAPSQWLIQASEEERQKALPMIEALYGVPQNSSESDSLNA